MEKDSMINHPSHYNQYSVEVIDMMEKIWGTSNTILFCEMNAFKYRMRLGNKNGMEEDYEKEQWYLAKSRSIAHIK
jgi:hypothetical protein